MDSKAPPSAGIYDLLGWFETNKRLAAIIAGGVALIGIVIGFVVWHQGESSVEAEEALAGIRVPFGPTEPTAPDTADKLASVARVYPGTSAAAKALLRAGSAYFVDGNYAKAREQYQTFIRDYEKSPWIAQAAFGFAACLDAENKTAEAINKYKDFIAAYSTDGSADQAKLNLARLYEQTGQSAAAFDVLSKMANQQGSFHTAEAQMRLNALLKKNPSLMPPPTVSPRPAVSPTVTPPGTSAAPKIIINPAQPTPGQVNPSVTPPKIILNSGQPTPGQPAPVQVLPTQPVAVQPGAPANPTPSQPANPIPPQPTPTAPATPATPVPTPPK